MGKNDRGQLGLGAGASTATVAYPVEVELGAVLATTTDSIVKVSTGHRHTLLLLSSGAVFGAGANSEGQCGTGGGPKTAVKVRPVHRLPDNSSLDIDVTHSDSRICPHLPS